MKNKELDKWIAENIMGWKQIEGEEAISEFEKQPQITDQQFHRKCIWVKGGQRMACEGCGNLPSYTESISDTFQVVEIMRTTHFKWFEMAHRPNGYICNFVGDPKYTEFAETAPLAICLAAKKALE